MKSSYVTQINTNISVCQPGQPSEKRKSQLCQPQIAPAHSLTCRTVVLPASGRPERPGNRTGLCHTLAPAPLLRPHEKGVEGDKSDPLPRPTWLFLCIAEAVCVLADTEGGRTLPSPGLGYAGCEGPEAAPPGSPASPQSLRCGPSSFSELDSSFGKRSLNVYSVPSHDPTAAVLPCGVTAPKASLPHQVTARISHSCAQGSGDVRGAGRAYTGTWPQGAVWHKLRRMSDSK